MSWLETELVKIVDTDIRDKIEQSLMLFWERDAYLLEHDMNEVSITHKLGCYLQVDYPLYDVDCEYNRNHHRPKQIRQRGQSRNIKPDIILHRRGSNEENFLVIEAKKSNNGDRAADLEKLQSYLEAPLEYINALYIEFRVGHTPITRDNFIKRLEFYSREHQNEQ